MSHGILVANNDPLVGGFLRMLLRSHGYQVVGTAGTGGEVVALAAQTRPGLVFMDADLPGLDGLAATRAIMSSHPTCIIVIAGRSEQAASAAEAGAMGFQAGSVNGRVLAGLIAEARERFARFSQAAEGAKTPRAALRSWHRVRQALHTLSQRRRVSERAASQLVEQRCAARNLPFGAALEELLAAGATDKT
jgi:AmiR/NasT family two-component response regulator